MINAQDLISRKIGDDEAWKVAVVIPCFKVKNHILDVLQAIPGFVDVIYVVDDACPEGTGDFAMQNFLDVRLKVIKQNVNKGVGGAVMSGYLEAKKDKADIIVKVDGDGQMDPSLMSSLLQPIIAGQADYTKGNRFYDLEALRTMPKSRILGNAVLSFMNKLSTGYWQLFDPTNGYTAIHADLIEKLPWGKISNRYFFESDLLFRLNTVKAVVIDIPMPARYGDEISNLKISRIIGEFLYKHKRNTLKRIFYNYFLRDFSVATLNLLLGTLFVLGGGIFGAWSWYQSAVTGVPQTAGTVMLAALPIILGLQLILAFLSYDVANVPKKINRN
jgi:dolichol-phosphate mannosyltransferase